MHFRKVGSDKFGTVFTNFGKSIHDNNTIFWGNYNELNIACYTKDPTIAIGQNLLTHTNSIVNSWSSNIGGR